MTERPILFSAPMVRAILAGQKTQTRRVVKWRGLAAGVNLGFSGLSVERSGSNFVLTSPTRTSHEYRSVPQPCPYGLAGDRLWVRETHAFSVDDPEGLPWQDDPSNWDVIYRADPEQPSGGWRDGDGNVISAPWRPSIHMPRWASRITLEITSVRVERLQAISEDDARAEGIFPHVRGGWHWLKHDSGNPDDWNQFGYRTAALAFQALWEAINGSESWEANPWVWCIEFNRKES